MGSTCASSNANIYLEWWERNLVFSDDLLEYTQPLWLCYIDDIVFIWSDSSIKFFEFINKLNINDINLKVTAEIDSNTVNFLDIRIYRQYLRVKRLCSNTDDFKIEAKKLYWHFRDRGYSHNSQNLSVISSQKGL
ncbi:hypothetical protein XELAEV_18010702mg [Xenopus laevis]|uniref:Reverse transcriptase domain-containing protein n=1 Tax=Xenopus laevis TaxID=8355 RepID=A0A974DV03_XENLA|nr:hypothetical protein XELAEV_18010702mg [Xenopus laevis]